MAEATKANSKKTAGKKKKKAEKVSGGVGLNLQSAAWLINLDIPWNPGTLEQRIGRIYRLGQEKPVNVINLVAVESIEHNMLGVLQFKKSMAAGVLDDGEDAIFMGDSKFKKFMASVEVITRDTSGSPLVGAVDGMEDSKGVEAIPDAGSAPEPRLDDAATATDDLDVPEEVQPQQATRTPVNKSEAPAPEALVQDGLQFFAQLARTLSDAQATEKLVKSIVHKDEKTGQTYVKLPVENEASVENVLNLLGGLFKMMGK